MCWTARCARSGHAHAAWPCRIFPQVGLEARKQVDEPLGVAGDRAAEGRGEPRRHAARLAEEEIAVDPEPAALRQCREQRHRVFVIALRPAFARSFTAIRIAPPAAERKQRAEVGRQFLAAQRHGDVAAEDLVRGGERPRSLNCEIARARKYGNVPGLMLPSTIARSPPGRTAARSPASFMYMTACRRAPTGTA